MELEKALPDGLADEIVRRLPYMLPIPVEASGRHVHLSQSDAEALFGRGHSLTPRRPLSQPGQYLCEERVSLRGPKGELKNVAVLGPARSGTQVELSMTDAAAIGAAAPVRESGDTAASGAVAVFSDGGASVELREGVIVAKRHLHATPNDAKCLGVADGDVVSVRIEGARPAVFEEVAVRVSEKFSTTIHIDYDEANACGFSKGVTARLTGKKRPAASR